MSLIFAMPGNAALAAKLAKASGWEPGSAAIRRFPDGESYVRVDEGVSGRDTAIVCTLARPDSRFLRLVFLARLLRELGARTVTLVAPYLPYLRQDSRFNEGEAVSSVYFAQLLSREFDRVVTVAPHLHRHRSLGEIYSVPTEAPSVAPLFAGWIEAQVADPLLVGPDSESEQWVSEVASLAHAPYLVLSKRRHGDEDVDVSAPDLGRWKGRRPVLVDDIVSSGATMVAAARRLIEQGFPPPVCLTVHALFGRPVEALLRGIGCELISTDTIPHPSNRLSVAALLSAQLAKPVGMAG